jgi:hypothetical protein
LFSSSTPIKAIPGICKKKIEQKPGFPCGKPGLHAENLCMFINAQNKKIQNTNARQIAQYDNGVTGLPNEPKKRIFVPLNCQMSQKHKIQQPIFENNALTQGCPRHIEP